jgi:hypothetical protein
MKISPENDGFTMQLKKLELLRFYFGESQCNL